jgi:hypothetical protein
MNPEDEAEEDGANIDLDSKKRKMCCSEDLHVTGVESVYLFI